MPIYVLLLFQSITIHKRLFVIVVKRWHFGEIHDIYFYFLMSFFVPDPEIIPLSMSFSVGVRSQIKVEFISVGLYHKIQVATFKIAIKLIIKLVFEQWVHP